ncbi:MAG: hypothetical protein HY983_03750 [Candidatus Magasanikbacteria bacterium]|nr:hypothetical protein [Candidatus Magasanikbacteria bacterium]
MYLKWKEKTITDFSDANINALYDQGYLFTREGKGSMYQTRSLRVDLSKFKLSSENRRVLKKTEGLKLAPLTLPYAGYHWSVGKLGKDFYETKFGPPRPTSGLVEAGEGTPALNRSGSVFSANKVKELLTDTAKSNFNQLFVYHAPVILSETPARLNDVPPERLCRAGSRSGGKNPLNTNLKGSFARVYTERSERAQDDKTAVGYCVARETDEFIHYCYPFYQLTDQTPPLAPPLIGEGTTEDSRITARASSPYKGGDRGGGFTHMPNLGLGMMTKAIVWAKENGKKYVYLGSFQRPTDTYKLQFAGLEWFDGERWKSDMEKLKKNL